MRLSWLTIAMLVGSQAIAGASAGPRASIEQVDAGKTDVYEVAFAGDALATVRLQGDHATNLDLIVLDGAGHPIAQDTGATDVAYLSFVPRSSGTFIIKVKNLGAAPNQYALTTN